MSQPLLPGLHAMLGLSCIVKIVDVGANPIDGSPPYAALLASGHARLVGFEPFLPALESLNRRKGPHETYLPSAVGDGNTHTLHHCVGSGMTSLLPPNLDVLKLFYNFGELGRVVRTEAVATRRLDDIPETQGLDYLKIDIQGAELMVFENASERLNTAVAIQTEVEFIEMYVGQPLFSEVEQRLRKHGFVLHRFEPMYSRTLKPVDPYCGIQQLMWADAIFVRDFTRPGAMQPGQLIKLAVILHDCYHAYDLVLHLLGEHDRRVGTAYAPPYLTAVRAIETRLAFENKAKA
jgi:FkbM family methyltransferase